LVKRPVPANRVADLRGAVLEALPPLKLHNTLSNGYSSRMNPAVPRTMLARLRASARLAVLVLVIFALSIGVAAACAKHDFAELGSGAESQDGATWEASASDEPDAPKKGSSAHASACSHCSGHHAAAMVPDAPIAFGLVSKALIVPDSGVPPSATCRLELRPPIA
jgi:hypothetical protein